MTIEVLSRLDICFATARYPSRRRPPPVLDCPGAYVRGPLRPPPRPLRVLDPRRGVPDPRARGAGRRARDARRRAHRPRLARRRDPALKETGKHGVKPMLGCEVYVADDRKAQAKGYAHLTLLAEDNVGYGNLIRLSSLGYLEGYYYKPRVDWELLGAHSERADRALRAASRGGSARRSRRTAEQTRRRARPARAALRRRLGLRRDPERRPRRPGADQPELGDAAEHGRPAARRDRRRALPAPRGRARARGAALHPVRRLAQEPEPLEVRHRPVLLQVAGRDGARTSRATSTRSRATLEIAERCNVTLELGQHPAARVPDAGRPRRVRLPRRAVRKGPAEALRRGHAGAARSGSSSS